MARPQKEGLDYFPLDVVLDDKFELIEAEFGLEGFAVCIKLMQKIYQNGYFYEWDDARRILFSKKAGIAPEKVDAIIESAFRWELLHRDMFERFSILTSGGIQKRFVKSVKKRVNVEMVAEYLLINVLGEENMVSVTETQVDSEKTTVSGCSGTQRKEKKRKELNTPLTPLPGEVEKPASPGNGNDQVLPSQKPVDEPTTDPGKTLPDKSGPPPCPHDEIVAAYHELLPECPRVREWGAPNRKQLAARWREKKERQELEWWRHVFRLVSASDWLMGRTSRDGPFVFSLGWFVKAGNFAKVLNGQYENRKQKPAGKRIAGLTF